MRTRRACSLALLLALLGGCGQRGHAPDEQASSAAQTKAEGAAQPGADDALLARYRELAKRIKDGSRGGRAYALLAELCDEIGARPNGSPALDQALGWARDKLAQAGHSKVAIEPVTIHSWVRGAESAALVEPRQKPLAMSGLGGSVGTDEGGLTADVVVADSLDALRALGGAVRGKIVLLNAVMPAYDPDTRDPGYGKVVGVRTSGPSAAAAQGAVAVLVRSLTSHSLGTPHTGALHYTDDAPKVPAAALSVEDADLIARLYKRGKRVVVRLAMQAHDAGDVQSGNVVAQIDGSERPEQVVVMGGHMDSWDVGQGAADDGAGVVVSMEALNLLRRLDLRPRRTLRVVLWTNEETDTAGAKAYALTHADELGGHVAGIESDTGGARVLQLNVEHPSPAAQAHARERLAGVGALLAPLGVDRVVEQYSGADLEPLRAKGIPGIGLVHDMSHYFDVHHSDADTLDKLDPDALDQSVAVLATTAYVLADMPGTLAGE